MEDFTNLLKKIIESNGGINITFENGKPKIKTNFKKEPTLNEKNWSETIFNISQKIDWAKLNEYLKKIQNQVSDKNLTEQLDEMLKKTKPTETNTEVKNNTPLINIYEYDDKYEFWIYATGFSKEEIKIDIEKLGKQNALVIEGELSYSDSLNTREKWPRSTPDWLINTSKPKVIKSEFALTGFKRTFKLNDDVDITNIKAHYENGILRVALWKITSNNKIKTIAIE